MDILSMRAVVLASGSKGNSTLIETDNSKILIDVGITNINLEKKLSQLNVDPNSIEGVFITHTHVDHVAGLKVFVKKYKPTVFLTQIMYDELKLTVPFDKYVIIDDEIYFNDITIKPFKTSHDAQDSVGYVFINNSKGIVYVTDTGYINQKYFDLLKNNDVYIFESNHDIQMLMDNPNYPYQTKQRILSDRGHLSNKDSSYYLSKLVGDKTKHIILAHLSEQNNTHELALEELQRKVSLPIKIQIATQEQITEVVEV